MIAYKKLLLLALLVVLLASLLEAIILSRRQGYDWRAAGVTLCNFVARHALAFVLPLSIATPILDMAWAYRLTTISLDSWQALLALFVGQEFCYYWFHRASHQVRWFWCNHSVHHTPNELNLAAALRSGIFAKLIGAPIFFAPLVWLGFPLPVVMATFALNLLYQFWIHASWIPRLGWLEYVLNTPSAHRVHHAANLDYLDANYGGVLIVFDRLFGTYIAERADLPCRYGLVKPITGYNPLHAEFSQWLVLLRDLARVRSIATGVGYLLKPPGWQPDGCGETTRQLRARQLAPAAATIAAGNASAATGPATPPASLPCGARRTP